MRKIFGLALLLLILVACGIDNTMYNAQNYFKSAQLRPLNANGRPTPQAVDEYTKTIKKCGMILSYKKNSPRADDALYLMARALFYKGNSAFQAKDAFESLIRGYPKSKFVPEAHIYLGKVLRDINQINESEAVLERFVRDPKFIKHHPRALLVLADFEIKDEDYNRAQFWLERIIKDYPKTDEFKEAFFLFGKNYYMQKDYTRSLQEFQTFYKTRGMNKEMRLEALYYIALNQFELGDFDSAKRNARSLIRNELRPEKLSAARVLYARTLLAEERIDDGLAELEEVTKSYPRTEQAAAAYYYWGKYLYFKKGDIDAATPHLNKVRTEFSNSPFATQGQKMATALAQIKRPANLNSRANLQGFLDHYYLKAEYFVSPLALPDSALASYQTVIDEYTLLSAEKDSLSLQIGSLNTEIDSLNALPEVMLVDSLTVSDAATQEPALELLEEPSIDTEEPSPADSTSLNPEPPIQPDADPEAEAELDLSELKPDLNEFLAEADSSSATLDSLAVQNTEALADSLIAATALEQRNAIVIQRDALQTRLDPMQDTMQRFEKEILPFCYFSIFSIYHNMQTGSADAELTLTEMQSRFPRNMYTRAARALKNGNTPRLVDPDLEAAEESFDALLSHYPEHPDSLLAGMQEFTLSPYPELQLRANYRLGWYYSFEAPDTTLAKDYLEAVLSASDSGDYGSVVRRFYDGAKYLLRDSGLIDSVAVADSLSLIEHPEADSLLFEHPEADSLLIEPGELDSLLVHPADLDSLDFEMPDSLNTELETEETVPEEDKDQEDALPQPLPPEALPPDKDEDSDSE